MMLMNFRKCKLNVGIFFPEEIRTSPRARLRISSRFPALSALGFEHCLHVITQHVFCCPRSESTRISRDYTQRKAGCYGKVAAFNGVVEQQVDGRLHAHITVYGSNYTPTLLTRLAACSEMEPIVRDWIDAVPLNRISPEVREWAEEWISRQHGPLPRACETVLPNVQDGFDEFKLCVEKRLLATNVHKHSSTCVKGRRGHLGCRLSRPAGIHDPPTQPLIITLTEHKQGNRGKLSSRQIEDNLAQQLDRGYDADNGELIAESCEPIVWEQHRPQEDNMFVETNIGLAAFTESHTNSAVLNGEDSGTAVEEYQLSYMTKEGAELKNTAVVMLTALDHIAKFPSSAEDSGNTTRTAKYLATRTVNAFSGSHEWPHALMVYALLGNRSYFPSDSYWYVYPHSFVNLAFRTCGESSSDGTMNCGEDLLSGMDEQEDRTQDDWDDRLATDQLSRLGDLLNTEDHTENAQNNGAGGARAFHVGKEIVFVSQSQSYARRGCHSVTILLLNFAALLISDLDEIQIQAIEVPVDQVERAMLGSAPPPTVHRNSCVSDKAMEALARYIICLFVPWDLQTIKPIFEPTRLGLAKLCCEWDRFDGPLVNRQRYRTIRNIIRKCARNSTREKICSLWRNRNAVVWKDMAAMTSNESCEQNYTEGSKNDDPEANGVLPTGDELYWLTVAAAVGNPTVRASVIAVQDTFRSIMLSYQPERDAEVQNTVRNCAFIHPLGLAISFGAIADAIHKMQSQQNQSAASSNTESGIAIDPLAPRTIQSTTPPSLSPEQQKVVDWILSNTDCGKQTLSVLHGGAGTGKSFLVRELVEKMKSRGLKVVYTCPTGAGACQLTAGQTFHSAFKTRCGFHLSRNALEKMREQFDNSVGLVVVDEISMISSEFLVLLDGRLRELYDPNQMFGGISVCLVGDFLQLNVLMGTPLCKAMYSGSNDETIIQARALFRKFRVFFLEQQQRAGSCERQQQNLLDCQELPLQYPVGQRWQNNDLANFTPISDAVFQSLTSPLTTSDVLQDPAWLDETTILVTSNTDRASPTATAVELFASRHNITACRWKKPLRGVDLPQGVQEALYDEQSYPELFAYFVPDGPAQILNNANGNVIWGVANGTLCRMHSLAWNDVSRAETVNKLVHEAREANVPIVDLPYPPMLTSSSLTGPGNYILQSFGLLTTIWKHSGFKMNMEIPSTKQV